MSSLKFLRTSTRPARRRIAKAIYDFPETWQHAAAQRYELEAARYFIREFFPKNYAEWEAQPADGSFFAVDDQWFCGDAGLFSRFMAHASRRQCLEIGSGPFGHLGQSKAFRHRTIIDPLLDAYRAIELQEFGKTFFTPDIKGHSVSAETRIDELVGKIDGLIVSRNCLDHCDDPLMVLCNIVEYASSGCWIFIWTDIWHLNGADSGHRNITRSPVIMEALIAGLGATIIKRGRNIGHDCIEFGCIAIKS